MLSIGMFVSVLSDGRLKAMAGAIIVWFGAVMLYDLGAVGFALAVSPSGRMLLLAVLGNPVECVRILAIMSLEPDLQVIGPLGAYVVNEVGRAVGVALITGALAAWVLAPMGIALRIFARQDV
jgi:Cu-processing system permease protein